MGGAALHERMALGNMHVCAVCEGCVHSWLELATPNQVRHTAERSHTQRLIFVVPLSPVKYNHNGHRTDVVVPTSINVPMVVLPDEVHRELSHARCCGFGCDCSCSCGWLSKKL